MSFNLKKTKDFIPLIARDSTILRTNCQLAEKWFEGFEEKQREIIIHFYRWFNENWPKMQRRFNLHSVSGLTPKDLLTFFIEKEILGNE